MRCFKKYQQVAKQASHGSDDCLDVYKSSSIKDSTRQVRDDDQSERQFFIGSQQKMPRDFDQYVKSSCFKRE